MVKVRIGEGVFGGVDYAWKVDGVKDMWGFLFELADNIEENMTVRSIECVGDISVDFPTDERRRYKSVGAFKDGAEEAKEFTTDVSFCVGFNGDTTHITAFLYYATSEVILGCSSDDEATCKKLDKLIRKWFDK